MEEILQSLKQIQLALGTMIGIIIVWFALWFVVNAVLKK